MASSLRTIGRQRGYVAIAIRQREPLGRGLRRAFNEASKAAWQEAATHFHTKMSDKRFTPEHAAAAGYALRRGQGLDPNSKEFKRSYYGRKLRSEAGGGRGRANPLVASGKARATVARGPRVTTNSNRARISYSGLPFNFRHPRSRVRMDQEFRRLIPAETQELAAVYDSALDRRLVAPPAA